MFKTQPTVAPPSRPARGRGSFLAGSTLLLGLFIAVLWSAFGSGASAESADAATAPDSPRVARAFGTAPDATIDDAPAATTSAPRAPAAFGSDSSPAPRAEAPAPAPARTPGNFGSNDSASGTTTDEASAVRRPQAFGSDAAPTPRTRRVEAPEAALDAAPLGAAVPISPTFVAAPVAVNQCNGTDNVGGQSVECTITVTNNVDLATGVTSSTMTIRECHGAANAAPTCTTTPINSSDVVTSVDQCNGSGNGGGGTVTCRVDITNNITGAATTAPVTVNQCNTAGTGGGAEPTIACNPFPANTTGATVTQCNEAGTGGGATMRVRCTVDTGSTETAAFPMTIEQCVGSGNGGGGFVTCSVSLRTNVIAAGQPTPTEPEPPTPTEPEEPTPTEPEEPTPGTPPTPGAPTPTPGTPPTPGAPTPTPGAPTGTPQPGTPAPGAPAPTAPGVTAPATATPGAPAAGVPTAALGRGSASRSTTGRGSVTGGGSATATRTGSGSGSATGQEFAVTGFANLSLLLMALITMLLGGLLVAFTKFAPARIGRT